MRTDEPMRIDESAVVKVAVKHAKRKNSVAEGFKVIYRWRKTNPRRSLDDILLCYRKAIKHGIIMDENLILGDPAEYSEDFIDEQAR